VLGLGSNPNPVLNLIYNIGSDTNLKSCLPFTLSAPDGSTWRHKVESEVETFKDISQLHSGDAAQLINNDGIHILINLNGYTKGSRNEIFALQPAPLQVAYMGEV
jgi:protein O-GlcNAc transferase